MIYAEYLKANGASDEEIKILDVPSARKAFDKLQKDAADAQALAETARKEKEAYEAQVEEWHAKKITPEYERMKNEALVAQANEAKARKVIEKLQKDGLIDVAKDLGWDTVDIKKPDNKLPDGFDPSKYVTNDHLIAVAEKEGEAIAMVADMVAEHQQLFPGQRLNVRELRKEATARKISVEQLWMEKYKVNDARAAAVKAEQDAHDKKIADEAYAKAQSEIASKYGNPDARPLTPSRSPLVPRPDSGRDKAPWEIGDKSGDRVQRATATVVKTFSN